MRTEKQRELPAAGRSASLSVHLEAAKAERLELLFQQSGRSTKGHPMHGLFTGLIAEAPSSQAVGHAAPLPAAASADQAEQKMG